MKYKNPFGSRILNHNQILDLDKFADFYFNFTDGFKSYNEKAAKIWSLIAEGHTWVEYLGTSTDYGKVSVGIEELNKRVDQIKEETGFSIPYLEGETANHFLSLTYSTMGLDKYLPDRPKKFMHDDKAEDFDVLDMQLGNNLNFGVEVDVEDWQKFSDNVSKFYGEVSQFAHIHRDLIKDIPYFEDVFRNKKIKFVNGDYDFKKIKQSLKRELGRECSHTIIQTSIIIDRILENSNKDRNTITTVESGAALEKKVAELYKSLGFQIDFTPSSGDFGIDILAKSDNATTGIQCKNYNGSAGVEAVMQAHSGASYYECSNSIVISPGGFTNNAYEMAAKLGVELLVIK